MAVVIRLTKVGKKGEAKFRVVVKEKRSKRDGKAIETLGWYIKTKEAEHKEINQERLKYWLSKGAQPSSTVAKIVNQ